MLYRLWRGSCEPKRCDGIIETIVVKVSLQVFPHKPSFVSTSVVKCVIYTLVENSVSREVINSILERKTDNLSPLQDTWAA